MRFDSFELRTPDGALLVRDRKSGFCLADHWGAAPGSGRAAGRTSSATASSSIPRRRASSMGTTPGYTDRYPAFFHGQNIDITGVPTGDLRA